MTEETWKPTYWTEYAASSEGRVKRVSGGRGARAGHILRPRINRDGYACVTLHRYGTKKGMLVSRLVCAAFHGRPPENDAHAAHIDGDKTNNRPENLRWATRAENEADKIAHGTIRKGEQVNFSKLTPSEVLAIRADTRSQRLIAADYGIAQGLVSMIKNRKVWAHV